MLVKNVYVNQVISKILQLNANLVPLLAKPVLHHMTTVRLVMPSTIEYYKITNVNADKVTLMLVLFVLSVTVHQVLYVSNVSIPLPLKMSAFVVYKVSIVFSMALPIDVYVGMDSMIKMDSVLHVGQVANFARIEILAFHVLH